MSRGAKGTSIEQVLKVFEKLDFDEKVKVFEAVKEYMKQETAKSLDEAKFKVDHYSKLHASIGQ